MCVLRSFLTNIHKHTNSLNVNRVGKQLQCSRVFHSEHIFRLNGTTNYSVGLSNKLNSSLFQYTPTSIASSQARAVNNTIRQFHVCCSCTVNFTMGRKNKRNNEDEVANNEKVTSSNPAGVNGEVGVRQKHLRKLPQPLSKIATKINLVVIGTGGPGTSQSLLVTTEYQRYLFNCGEGTQRFAAMSKSLRASAYAKLAGLEHVFITHKSWENTGGLLGMVMTLEGQKNPDSKSYLTRDKIPVGQENPQITIHGPPGVENIASMAKKFSNSGDGNLNIVRHDGNLTDESLTVTPVPFYHWTEDDSSPAPAKRQRRLSGSDEMLNGEAYAYLCQAQPQLPKINVEKCLEAGITIGPMVGCLQRGESVTLADGRVVHPDQVTDVVPSDDRPFLVVECPNLGFLPSLCQCTQLLPYLDKSGESLAVIVHMTPAEVFNSADYQSWMSGFHNSTDHMVINREARELDLIRVREHQAKLNLVSQEVFPMLPHFEKNTANIIKSVDKPGAALPQTEEGSKSAPSALNRQGQVVKACPGLLYIYRGKEELGFQIELDEFNCKDVQTNCLRDEVVEEHIAALRNVVKAASTENSKEEENITRYPKVTFLGTGSSEPNLMRAQSCIVVQMSKHTTIMLDCGEDSYGQMYRFFGKAKTNQILRKIKAIFISHMHADHYLGLFSLLKERKIAFDESSKPFAPVLLLAPIQMRRWLKFYNLEMDPVTHLFRFVKHQEQLSEFLDELTMENATVEDVQKELSLTEYKSVAVEHCNNAFGVSFTHANGFKLVYSGDTRPCDRLVTAGKDCDLLIHEATHEDCLLDNAKSSKHSTFSEAINIGKRMKAKNIILTHFSQRYAYMVPLFDVDLPPNVGVAFDNMQVSPRTMRYLPHMIPALTALFAVELQRFEAKTIRRLREKTETRAQQNKADS